MDTRASQIISLTIVYLTVYSVQIEDNIIHVAPRHWPLCVDRWIPRTNDQERWKCFQFDDVIMIIHNIISCHDIHVWISTLTLSILGNVVIIATPHASIHYANVSIYKQELLMGSHCWRNGNTWIDDTIRLINQTHITLCSRYRYVNWRLNVIERIGYFDGLGQDCSNSIANTVEILQSCTKPSIYRDIHTVYRLNYAHGFVVLCFLHVTLWILVDIYELLTHDHVIKRKRFPRYRPQVNSPHKGQWCGGLIFFLSAPE